MLDSLGIETHPGWSADVADMSDFFSSASGSVVINSPANNSVQGPSILVNAAASELDAQVDHMEVWDTFNGTPTKLGNVFSKTIDQAYTVSGNGVHIVTVQDIGGAPSYPILHKKVTTYTVSSNYGVFVKTPANGSTQATLFPLIAFALESGAQGSSSGVDHIEIWNGNTKLGDSPEETTISQWFSLAPGPIRSV